LKWKNRKHSFKKKWKLILEKEELIKMKMKILELG
jgi:hypothetical protein